MAIKKVVRPINLPGVHPGLAEKIREAEKAELRGEMPRQVDAKQKITRPTMDAYSVVRKGQVKVIGLVEGRAIDGADRIAELATAAGYKAGVNLDEIWDSLSESQKIRAGAVERFRLVMDHTIKDRLGEFEEQHKIGGRLDQRNLDRSGSNLKGMLDAFGDQLAPDSRQLLDAFVDSTYEQFKQCLRQNAVAGIDGPTLYPILRDWVEKMVYQELVSREAAMGDRGIRRICANIELADSVYQKFKRLRDYSPRWQLLMRLIHIHQDLGYAAYAARVSFRGTKMHRAYGARIFTDELNRYRALFTHAELELARFAVATHSSEEFPFASEKILALVRAVDHLAPLAPHRVYLQLEDIGGAHPYLDAMLERLDERDWEGLGELKVQLASFLMEAKLPMPLVEDIFAAFRPFHRMADPIDLGTSAGVIKGLSYESAGEDDPGTLTAEVYANDFARRYQVLFDYQQDQFMRLAKQTGVAAAAVRSERELRFQAPGEGALVVKRLI